MTRLLLLLSLAAASSAALAQQVGPAPVRVDKATVEHPLVLAEHAYPAYRVRLAAPDPAELDALRAHNASAPKRLQIGIGRALPPALAGGVALDALAWQTLADGGRVAVLEIESPGAAGLRVALDRSALSKGLAVRAFAPGRERLAHAALVHGKRAGTVWLPEQRGPVVALELHAAPGFDLRGARLPVVGLSHLVASPYDWDLKNIADVGDSGSCNIDAVCRPAWFDIAPAVAKYTFSDDEGSYLCTGTLLNNLNDDGAPLFLTARHCIEHEQHASTMVFYWHFEKTVCGEPHESSATIDEVTTTGGAELLAATPGSLDAVLVMLVNDPSPDAILSGWNAETPARFEPVASLHHPLGDAKKFAGGEVTDFTAYNQSSHSAGGNHLRVEWDDGTTEGGSSGAGLFNGDHALIGTLHGGSASCDADAAPIDWYSRFDLAYDTFEPWLVDGFDAVPPEPVPPTVVPLSSGAAVSGTLAEAEWHYYSIAAAATHDELEVVLSGLSADADLYVRRGEVPDLLDYDCRSWNSDTEGESCLHQLSGAGTWYIGVYGYDDGAGYTLRATLTAAPPPPAGGGGGRIDAAGLLMLVILLAWRLGRQQPWTSRSSSSATRNGRR